MQFLQMLYYNYRAKADSVMHFNVSAYINLMHGTACVSVNDSMSTIILLHIVFV